MTRQPVAHWMTRTDYRIDVRAHWMTWTDYRIDVRAHWMTWTDCRYLTYGILSSSRSWEMCGKVRRMRQMRGRVQQYLQKTQKNFYRTFVTLCLIRLIRLTFKYNQNYNNFQLNNNWILSSSLDLHSPFPPNRYHSYLTNFFSSFKRIYIEYIENSG